MLRNEQSTDKIYVIKNTETGEFWKAGSKVAWATPAAAKNAFNLHSGCRGSSEVNYTDKVYFDEQTKYTLVELNYKEVFNG